MQENFNRPNQVQALQWNAQPQAWTLRLPGVSGSRCWAYHLWLGPEGWHRVRSGLTTVKGDKQDVTILLGKNSKYQDQHLRYQPDNSEKPG